MEFKFNASKEAADWLVGAAGRAAQGGRGERSGAAGVQEQNGAVASPTAPEHRRAAASELNAAVTKAKTERINKEALYNQLKAMQSDRGARHASRRCSRTSTSRSSRASSPTCSVSRRSWRAVRRPARRDDQDPHGDAVRRSQAPGRDRQGRRVGAQRVQAALSEERSLQGALDSQKGEALSLNRKGIEYGVLQREAESNRQIYESLMQRTKETGISGERRPSNIRVVDPAEVPRAPILPRTPARHLTLALVGGLRLRGRPRRSSSSISTTASSRRRSCKATLGVPFLGMVPALSEQATSDPLHHRRRAGELRRSVPDDPDQRAVLVGRRGLRTRRRDERRAPAKARASCRATSRSRSRRPGSACC